MAPQAAERTPSNVSADPARIAAHDIDVGETYLAGNNFDSARERFEEALRLTPDNPLIWFRLAQALQGMQRLIPLGSIIRSILKPSPKANLRRTPKNRFRKSTGLG